MGGARCRAASLPLTAVMLLVFPLPAPAQDREQEAGGLKVRVTELAQTVDLSRGSERFLTVTVEISGVEPARLRRVQPLRDEFQVLAGKATLPCRWLRGGTLPEDPARLRFTLGFSMPPRSVRTVTLQANLPHLESEDVLELPLTGLSGSPPWDRRGKGWSVSVVQFGEQEYEAPALPNRGQFSLKGMPVDSRVFQKTGPKEPVPARAVVVAFRSREAAVYDSTLDVSGSLLVEGGGGGSLASAFMRRVPSRLAQDPATPPLVEGRFYFPVPAKGRATGAVLRFHRRAPSPRPQPIRIDKLPVPGA